MSSTIVSVASITMAAIAMVLTAAAEHRALHLAIAAIVTVVMIALCARDFRAAVERGDGEAVQAAVVARYMGILWAWSAICLALTYVLILVWSSWGGAFILSSLASGLYIFLARILEREGGERWLGPASLLNCAAFVLSTIVLGAIPVLVGYAGLASAPGDWAAINLMNTTMGGVAFVSGLSLASLPIRRAT